MNKTALVVANELDADAGYVGERLVQRGFALSTVLRESGDVPADVTRAGDVDLVVLLGSDWSVHSPVDATSLATECSLAVSAQAAGVPVLGLCYGAQVIARAFGGSVAPAAQPEIGWTYVDSDAPELVPSGPWLEFHVDGIEAPPGARVIARNSCGLQAFVLPGMLAVQFHPEVRPEIVDDWSRRSPELLAGAGIDREQLRTQSVAREPAARAAAYALVDAFVDGKFEPARPSSNP